MTKDPRLIRTLESYCEELIARTIESISGVREGIVMTVGPPPYRRLDCDARALAYIRVRPRKRAVRVDISGLWLARSPSSIRIPTSSGAATLMIRSYDEIELAVRYLVGTVEATRKLDAPVRPLRSVA